MTYTSSYLRRTFRQDGTVQHETLGNLSDLPVPGLDWIRRSLQGESFVPAAAAFHVTRARPQGQVEAVLKMIRQLGLDDRVASAPSRRRALVLARIAERLLFPSSKLANTRHWLDTPVAEELDGADATADPLDDARDWLRAWQEVREKKLAQRHVADGARVLSDVTSSSSEGPTCPRARFGPDRDGKTGRPILGSGAGTDADGRPVAVPVYPGHTADPTTVPDQVETLTKRCGRSRVVLVGDRGRLTQTQIEVRKKHPGLGGIAAWRRDALRRRLAAGPCSRTALEAQRLAEITTPDFPDERRVACSNPQWAEPRRQKRPDRLAAPQAELEALAACVAAADRPETAAEIGGRAGQVLHPYQRAQPFTRTIRAGHRGWAPQEEALQTEELRNGIAVIRTSEPAERLTAAAAVRSDQRRATVEPAFRCLQGLALWVRPIHHRTADRGRAPIGLCLLASSVEWHRRRGWASLLFEDEEWAVDRTRRDPVAPAQASASARLKKKTHRTSGGLPAPSFRTLLAHLGTRCRNTCVLSADPARTPFRQVTEADALQTEALRLITM